MTYILAGKINKTKRERVYVRRQLFLSWGLTLIFMTILVCSVQAEPAQKRADIQPGDIYTPAVTLVPEELQILREYIAFYKSHEDRFCSIAEEQGEVRNAASLTTVSGTMQELLSMGRINGVEFGIGSKTRDIVEAWGPPDYYEGFQAGLYLQYGNIIFFTNSWDLDDEGYVSVIGLGENINTYGARVGMSCSEIKAILGQPAWEGYTGMGELGSGYENEDWVLYYQAGSKCITYLADNGQSPTLCAYLWNRTMADLAGSSFYQGDGYQAGAYDQYGAQPSAYNWNRQSRFAGPYDPGIKWVRGDIHAHPDSSPVIAADGTIYLNGSGSTLLALDAQGKTKWKYQPNGTVRGTPAIGKDGTIYGGTSNGVVYAVDPAGKEKWQCQVGGILISSPVIAADGTIYIGSMDNKLCAVTAEGNIKWEFPTSYPIMSTAAIGSDGTIYFVDYDGRLYALEPNGQEIWSYRPQDDHQTGGAIDEDGAIHICAHSSPAIGPGGTIYYMYHSGSLLAVNPDGSLKWEQYVNIGNYCYHQPAISSDGTVYMSTHNTIYAFNANGGLKWKCETDWFVGPTVLIDAYGDIYVNYHGIKGGIWSLSSSGYTNWKFPIDNLHYQSLPALSPDGTIYISDIANGLLAVKNPPVLKADKTGGYPPLTVEFSINTEAAVDQYLWFFNHDGITDLITTSNTIRHTFDTPGVYPAKVIVKDKYGTEIHSRPVYIYVEDPPFINGELTFVPYYPINDTVPSEIMNGGRAFRYYRLVDQQGNPFINKPLFYRYIGQDKIRQTYSDSKGFARIETPYINSDTHLQVEILDNNGQIKEDVVNAPAFDVKVTNRIFNQEWSILFGTSLKGGWGGPKARLGPIDIHTVEAGLKGGRSSKLTLDYEDAKNGNEMNLTHDINVSLDGSVSAGLFGDFWKGRNKPNLKLGYETGLSCAAREGVGYTFIDFLDEKRPDHFDQALAAGAFILDSGVASLPQDPVGFDKVWKKIMHSLTNSLTGFDNYHDTLTSNYAVGGKISGGAKASLENPLGRAPGASIGLSLADFEGEVVFSHETKEKTDGSNSTDLDITRTLRGSFLKVNLGHKFSGQSGGENVPELNVDDIIPGAWEQVTEGKEGISVERQGNLPTSIKINKTVSLTPSGGAFFATDEKELSLKVSDREAIDRLANNSDIVQNLLDSNHIFIGQGTVDELYDTLIQDEQAKQWEREKKESTTISVPFDIGLGLGLQLELGLKLEGKEELIFTEKSGVIGGNLGMLTLQEYQKDSEIIVRQKKLEDFVKVCTEALAEPVKQAVKSIGGKIGEGINWFGASLRGSWDNCTGYLSWIEPERASYRIMATDSESTALSQGIMASYPAATVGDVYIVNLQDANGNMITDFSSNQLELTLGYSDESLIAAGFEPDMADKLAIYRWDGHTGLYVYQPGQVNPVDARVTASISYPGQYILAIDVAAPTISQFQVSDGTPTPIITAIIKDDFSSINPTSFVFKLDGEAKVTEEKLNDYFDPLTGKFSYKVKSRLTDGIHRAEITVGDLAGNQAETEVLDFIVNAKRPVINLHPVEIVSAGKDLPITATITDDTGVKSAWICFKPYNSELEYQTVAMIAEGNNQYRGIINDCDLQSGDIIFYIKALDLDGNQTTSGEQLVRINDNTPPLYLGEQLSSDGGQITVSFNENLKSKEIKSFITLTRDGENFDNLSPGDVVTIIDHQVKITLTNPLVGNNNRLKLAANVIEDLNGNVVAEEILGRILSVEEDTVIPQFVDGYPQLQEVLGDRATVTFMVNKNSRVYFIVQEAGGTAPGLEHILAGQDGTGTVLPYASRGFIETWAERETTKTFLNLLPGMTYEVYLVIEDSTGNIQGDTTMLLIDTSAGEGCFIATAAFGSKFTWPVALLREFRDQYLLTNSWGTSFVSFYYKHSPPIAATIASSQPLKILVKVFLAPVIGVVYVIYHPLLPATLLLLFITSVIYCSRRRARE